jgi:uncharacterized ferritin-like protein (DUF455 family)
MVHPSSYNFNCNETTAFVEPTELRSLALQGLCTTDPQEKVAFTQNLYAQAATLSIAKGALTPSRIIPGRPTQPMLMTHLNIPKRSPYTPDGLAALVHAVCHIEFNAINLALDAIWRFADMPRDYYLDWLRIASEEATHFDLLSTQLRAMGSHYGAFAAHNGLWDMTEKTADNITARMALVPRTLEARGLDATPPMQEKLRKVGSPEAIKLVAILEIILRDEIGHVAIGNRWYHWLCQRDGLEPVAYFRHLIAHYKAPQIKPPFNEAARRQAGFTDAEMQALLTP